MLFRRVVLGSAGEGRFHMTDSLFERIHGFLSSYEPLTICSTSSEDDRWINQNLGFFLHGWFDGHVYMLDASVFQKNGLATFMTGKVAELPQERVCAMIGMTAPSNEKHAYLLYRDNAGGTVYMYNGRGRNSHVECGIQMSPIEIAIQDVQESFQLHCTQAV